MLFLIHVPPGTQQCARYFPLDFRPPWEYAFVDDLRPTGPPMGVAPSLVHLAIE